MQLTPEQRAFCDVSGLPEQLVVDATNVPGGLGEAFAPKDNKEKDDKDPKKDDSKESDKNPASKPGDSKAPEVKKGNPFGKKDDGPSQVGGPQVPPFAQQRDPNVETPEEKKAKKAAKLQDQATKDVAADHTKRLNSKPDTITFYPSTERTS